MNQPIGLVASAVRQWPILLASIDLFTRSPERWLRRVDRQNLGGLKQKLDHLLRSSPVNCCKGTIPIREEKPKENEAVFESSTLGYWGRVIRNG